MAYWWAWFVAAAVMVIFELFAGTFYLLMMAIGLFAGGALAWLGGGVEWQLLVAALVGVAATMALRRSRFGRRQKPDAARDPNVNLDIGQSITVPAWQQGTARVMYRGALWDVDLAPGAAALPGTFTIREIQGCRLIVS